MSEKVPKSDLEELVERWREDQQRRKENPNAHPIQAQVLGRCAGELEAVLEE